jgi:tetratricopeptide (TPR) repeat protein
MDPRKNPPTAAPARAGAGPSGPATPEAADSRRDRARRNALIHCAIGLVLVAITVVAYWGVWKLDFVYFDDPGYVSQNLFVQRGLTWENVGWAFTSFVQSNWHPLSWLSHMADCQFFHLPDATPNAAEEDTAKPGPAGLETLGRSYKPDAGKHHCVNVAFHIANTLLLFWLLWRMTGATWRSGLVAALFAVHPLHVESVAWVAERKDVLSTFLGLLTLHVYVSYARRPMSPGRTLWAGASSLWVAVVWLVAYYGAIVPILYPQPVPSGLPLAPTLWVAAALTLPVLAVYGYLSWRYLLVIAGLALGLLAKPMLVTLPFVCLLLDYWPLGRVPAIRWPLGTRPEPQPQRRSGPQVATRRSRRAKPGNAVPAGRTAPPPQEPARQPFWRAIGYLALEKLPLILLVVASSRITYYAQRVGGAMADDAQLPLAARLENAGRAYWAYIGKMLVPQDLGFLYMLPAQQDPDMAWLTWLCLAAATALVLWAAWRWGRRYLAFGWLWYLGTLVPVIGLVQVGDQRMADRYTYVPLVGLFLIAAWGTGDLIDIAAWGAAKWIDRGKAFRSGLVSVTALVWLALVAVCVGVTQHQLRFWCDTKTVLEHAIAVEDRNCKAHNNLAVRLWEWKDEQEKQARLLQNDPARREEAEEHRRKAAEYKEGALEHWRIGVKLQANDPYTHANLGHVLFEASQTEADPARRAALIDEAIEHVRLAILNRSILPEPHNTLGRILWTQGKLEEAAGEFREALKYAGDLMPARENLTKLLVFLKKWDEAQEQVTVMLSLNPNYAGAWFCQGQISTARGRKDEALAAWEHAARADPNNVAVQDAAAMAYWQQGKRAEAAPHLRALLRLDSDPAGVADRFGMIFYQQKNLEEAARAWTFMAWSLATSPLDHVRNGAKAVELGRRAVDLSRGGSAAAMDALAAGYAETQQFADALRVAQQALTLAQTAGDAALVQAVQARIALYQQGRPFRDTWESP